MAEEKKEKNPRVLRLSLVFLVVFTMVFSLGVVVGKKFIPPDGPVSAEKSPGLLEKLFSFGSRMKLPSGGTGKPDDSSKKTPTRDEYLSAMINPDHKYTIQVSSFLSKKVANRSVRFYKDKGYPAFVREYSPSEITTFYRVRIGSFQSKEEAQEFGNEIKEKERDFKFYVTIND
ncbi:MAG: SPOR domain-containing protein [Candidatus Dadabacteria bacterium]|nr:SPOR domain-containing protein [Candidatus Dadabacteria bacterium]